MCVLGGRLHWLGPVIGAAVVVVLQERLASAGLEGWRLVILGAVLIVLVVAAPNGLEPRLEARPLPALAAFLGVAVVAAVAGFGSTAVDRVGLGLVAAAVVALWPVRRRAVRPEDAAPAAERLESAADESPADEAPAEPRSLVRCEDVSKHFGGVRALHGLTLEIRSGEIIGLVGPNGSGKTTLVNLLAGTFSPTSGRVLVEGRDTRRLAPHRITHAGMARTYQTPRPFESMTVGDNVAMTLMFGRNPRNLPDARREAHDHLEFVGLARRAADLPAELNLHQRQLLEMARAVASNPTVLLLDEAMAGLNPVEIDNAVQVVRRIHRSGIAIVVVEHLLRVVNQLATRVVVLDQGGCLADGDPKTVMSDPAVVRAYLGRTAHA
jgi:branched-chain amino acid transport system permease protein